MKFNKSDYSNGDVPSTLDSCRLSRLRSRPCFIYIYHFNIAIYRVNILISIVSVDSPNFSVVIYSIYICMCSKDMNHEQKCTSNTPNLNNLWSQRYSKIIRHGLYCFILSKLPYTINFFMELH